MLSRSTTDTEKKYSQIELEALAIVWVLEAAKIYLIGCEFDLVTDNKPIQLIFGNPKAKTCARIDRWGLRLIPYNFKIRHEAGHTNIADFLSRNPLMVNMTETEDFVEEYVNMIVDNGVPAALKLKVLIDETNNDPKLKLVKEMIKSNQKDLIKNDSIQQYVSVRTELSVTNEGVILKNNKIVIPSSLESEVIKIGHEGHQSTEKVKQLLEMYVWFPNMASKINKLSKSCLACQANADKKNFHPLQMSQVRG